MTRSALQPPNLRETVKTEIEARKDWKRPLDPNILKVDPLSPQGVHFMALREFAIKAPAVALPLLEGTPFGYTQEGRILLKEAAGTDFELATAYDPEQTLGLLKNPEDFSHAIKVSLLAGNIVNVVVLCRAAILERQHTASQPEISVQIRREISKLCKEDGLSEKDRSYLELLDTYLVHGGTFDISRARRNIKIHPVPLPPEYENFEARAKNTWGMRAADVLRVCTPELYPGNQERIEKLLTLAQDRAPQLCCSLKQNPLLPQLDALIALYERWGPEAWGFVCAYDTSAFSIEEKYRPVFERMYEALKADERDDDFGITVASIPHKGLENFPAHIDAIISQGKCFQHYTLCGLSTYLCAILTPEAIGAIAKHSRFHGESTVAYVMKLVRGLTIERASPEATDFSTFITEVAPHLGDTIPVFLHAISPKLYRTRRADLITLAQQHGKNAGALLQRFQDQALGGSSIDPALLKTIKQTFAEGAPHYIAEVPPELLNEPAAVFKRWGKGAGFVYRALGKDFEGKLNQGHWHIIERNRSEFGLTALHRYARIENGKVVLQLLRENLENLNPKRFKNRPIAVVAYARDDHNNAFAFDLSSLFRLASTHKLFVVEVGSTRELIAAVKKIVNIHGIDSDGRAKRPIDFFGLHAHGYRDFILWRDCKNLKHADRSIDGELLVTEHGDEVQVLQHAMSPSGLCIVGSCESSFGGSDYQNPLRIIKRAVGEMEVEGTRRSASVLRYLQSPWGQVTGGHYSCSTRKVVRM